MRIGRMLVAVDDSPASLHSAGVAIDLAAEWGARILLLTVATDHTLEALLEQAAPDGGADARLARAGRALLAHLSDAARSRGVEVDTLQVSGEPFRAILEQARSWDADLIIMGRSNRLGPSSPYVGSVTAQVLEFADRPVLVVPRSDQ